MWKQRIRSNECVITDDEWKAVVKHYTALRSNANYHLQNISDGTVAADLKLVDTFQKTLNDVTNALLDASFIKGAATLALLSSIAQGVQLQYRALPKNSASTCCISSTTTNVIQCRIINDKNQLSVPYTVSSRYRDILNSFLIITHHEQYLAAATATANAETLVSLRRTFQYNIQIIYWSLFL
jgi:hypothetical protein